MLIQTLFAAIPGLCLALTLDFKIVAVSDAYLQATMRNREDILGRMIFDIYPGRIEDLRTSVESVLKQRTLHKMDVQKHNIPQLESKERYWRGVSSPIFDANGEMTHIIHQVEDITEFVCLQQQIAEEHQLNQALQMHIDEMKTKIYLDSQKSQEVNKKLENVKEELSELDCAKNLLQIEAQTAEANLKGVLSSIRDGFAVLDRHWYYTYINDRQSEIIGKQREDVLGKNIWELFPDLVNSEFYNRLHQAILEQTATQFEYYYPTWNRWFENRVYPTPDGMSIICAEITKRKQTESALQESEARFRLLAKNSTDIISRHSTYGTVLYVSPAVEIVLGYKYEELIGHLSGELVHPEDIAEIFHKYPAIANLPNIYTLTHRLRHKAGHYIWIETTVQAVRDPQTQQMLEFQASSRDITERKQVEEALRQSELNFRTLADSMPQLFWTTHSDGYHDYFNRRWYEYTGMTSEQTQGWGWSHLLHPDDRQRCLDIWNECLSTGKEYNIDYRFRQGSDGEYRWFLGRAIPLRDADGQIIKWFGSCTDIHSQRLALEERDQALKQEQIARTEAETANRIKDEFLAVLSHELRTPLNPILGWAKLLRSRKFDAIATERALETIERNAKLQVQLIDDLLDISRILRGKLSLNVTLVDLDTVIFAALETVNLAAQAKSLQIQTTITASVGVVNGDAARLQQVVWNLLSNAVKFTPEGGVINISLTKQGKYAVIQVEDTGKGIHCDFLPYVFDYFRQEDGAITRKFGGLGLGLAIARQIVEMHGGTITANSPGLGQGASFKVQIPIFQASGGMPMVEELPTLIDLNGIKILVVDDDADSREFIAFALEQEQAIVTTAKSGLDALEVITQFIPDIIVSDIGMPEMDGYMLMREIKLRNAQKEKEIKAIALTAYAGELDRQQALKAGFQEHLTKPVEIDSLVNAILTLSKLDKS